jgi:membrane protease YdiL (CAAX protease family)
VTESHRQVYALLGSWLGLAFAGGLLTLLVRRAGRSPHLLPPQRRHAVPWSGAACLGAVAVAALIPALVTGALDDLGFFRHLYGPAGELTQAHRLAVRLRPILPYLDTMGRLAQPAAPTLQVPSAVVQHLDQVAILCRLWGSLFALPLQIAAIVIGFRLTSGTRAYQLGLTFRRAPTDFALGFTFWLGLTPVIYLLHLLAVVGYITVAGHRPAIHPLMELAQQRPPGQVWLMVVQAVLVAPVLEELLFRGVLQPWFGRRRWGGDLAMFIALASALFMRSGSTALLPTERENILTALAPALFVLAMIPVYRLFDWATTKGRPSFMVWLLDGLATHDPVNREQTARAIFGTSMLFASFHAAVWPTPIPLFGLGMGLGWLAYRTQGLVAPITLHMLFNAVGVGMLLLPT